MAKLIEQAFYCIIFRCILDLDGTLTDADIEEQMKQNLALNVYRGGQWGMYCHLPMETGVNICLVLLV